MGNILIIDDDPLVTKVFSEMVKTLGHKPFTAANAMNGLQAFKDNNIDITFVDIKMPGKSGLEFLEEVKNIDENAIVTVITGFPSSETITETILLNGFTYLEKPITIEKLRSILEKGFKRKRELESKDESDSE